jgi:cell division protein FtsL
MNDGIVIALITGGLSLFGSIFASITTSRLIIYRVNELEKKQDKHNGLIERMVCVEQSTRSAHKRIDEIKEAS